VVNPEASVSENVVAIAQNIGERAQEQFAVAKEEIKKRIEQTKLFIDDPEVEQLQEDVIAPTVVTVSAVSIIPSLFGILIPLLRFLFLQPLLFLGLRKRDAWGVVYNAYTKLPVDLVTVRLIDIKTNRPKKAVVTDKEGRFWFTADPGEYRIEISKQNFAFPSEVVPQGNIDGKFIDVYHGGTIQVSEEGAAITPSIPIDPHGRHKTPLRVRLEAFGHQLQHSIAAIGIIATFISFLIAPSVLLFGYLVVHIGLYFVFSEFVKPQKPKGWGMIYDGKSKEPVKHAVARLFTAEYDKLVATQITDGKGRYAFLVGPNDYYVRVEKTGYEELVRENIHIADQDESVIKEDLSLKPILAGDEQKQDEKNVL
jgi:hypothetical protein